MKTDWTAQCEAKCRKTGKQCPHICKAQIPNTIAGSCVLDKDWFSVSGRQVRLCQGHHRSWCARAKRLLALPLIEGGHLSPYNSSGFGSIVVAEDRVDFKKPRMKIPKAWGVISWSGNVPAGLLERLPRWEGADKAPEVPRQFSLCEFIQRQKDWSKKTFGGGPRTKGITSHIRKELFEVEAAPADLKEWVDVVILALDGAWRAGHQPEAICRALTAKQQENFGRSYPMPISDDHTSEHLRDGAGEVKDGMEAVTTENAEGGK